MAKSAVDPLQAFLTSIGGPEKAREFARRLLEVAAPEAEPEGKGKDSPLQEFLRKLDSRENREAFAAEVSELRGEEGKSMSVLRLYQMAGLRDPNPTLRVARALVTASQHWAEKLKIEALTYDDLLVGKTNASRKGKA